MKWLISEAWQFQLFWCNDLGYIACWWKVLQVVAWKCAVYLNVYFLIVIPLNIIQSDIFPSVTLLPHRTRWSPIHLTVTYCELFLFFYCLGGPSDQTCPALVTLENGKVEPKRHTWFLLWCFVFVSLRLLFWVMVSVVSVQLYVFSCMCSVVCVQLYLFSCICSVVSVQLYLFREFRYNSLTDRLTACRNVPLAPAGCFSSLTKMEVRPNWMMSWSRPYF